MKALLVLFAVCGLFHGAAAATNVVIRHYVQVVRGSDQSTPPSQGATLVGAKIRKQLEPIFRWKTYWEVQRISVGVDVGKVKRVDLVDGHSLEIDLRHSDKRTIRLYRGKKLVRTAVCSRDKEFCTQGLKSPDGVAWFIVVRTDPPAT